MRVLAGMALLMTAADHWTTWLCLHRPVDNWEVVEANPLAEWLFHSVGLLPGLAIDSFVTLLAVAFLWRTPVFTTRTKCSLLAVILLATGYAVANNAIAISMLGISPLGRG